MRLPVPLPVPLPVSLWLPLALAGAAVAAGAAGPSPLQRRVVRDVLEYFHGRSNVHFLFRERDVDGVIERRKPTCLACYKFDTSDVPKVLDKYHNCGPSHHLAAKEIRQRDEAECRAVEAAGGGGDGPYLPGMFAFSRGLPA
ncbi:retinoic acid receptor responder protein 2 isoform X2 [Oenanthe melanoleuca]|uniref:retinoic acid receptor responder protein 2 isoform X2 n=1 Tax=Oenanthe melanoleuca TaxID=2939378 RepID=UPI0024C0FE9F|nr:retinoic acid receptor responder protein 2 isoform X2 [Oenanthe melanoleuca]